MWRRSSLLVIVALALQAQALSEYTVFTYTYIHKHILQIYPNEFVNNSVEKCTNI